MNSLTEKILFAEKSRTHLFSVGQAGYIIKSSSGQLLCIDLYLSECVERIERNVGFKRLLPKLLSPFDLVFDCIIATHPHYDHFDMDSLPQMMSNQKSKLFASVKCKKEVDRLKMLDNNVCYVSPGNSFACGDFKLNFINCDHGTGAPDAVGVIITVDGKNILCTGDTCLRLDRKDEYLSSGKIDILIAPINGAYGNLNEKECALLADLLKPKLTIPSHYGMFASHGGNLGEFYRIMKEEFPGNNFLIMCQGEQYTF